MIVNVLDIIVAYLKAAGFDGLCQQEGHCTCCFGDGNSIAKNCVDEDLLYCQPGYKVPMKLGDHPDMPDQDWYIVENKPIPIVQQDDKRRPIEPPTESMDCGYCGESFSYTAGAKTIICPWCDMTLVDDDYDEEVNNG
jgi:LSD1 subclass zinc finger protein